MASRPIVITSSADTATDPCFHAPGNAEMTSQRGQIETQWTCR
jgi:hypothetical protein